jgi:hypothetical protein
VKKISELFGRLKGEGRLPAGLSGGFGGKRQELEALVAEHGEDAVMAAAEYFFNNANFGGLHVAAPKFLNEYHEHEAAAIAKRKSIAREEAERPAVEEDIARQIAQLEEDNRRRREKAEADAKWQAENAGRIF